MKLWWAYGWLLASIAMGVVWSRSGLWVNTFHLVVGSLIMGVALGSVWAALVQAAIKRRYIYTAFSPCKVCGKEVLAHYPLRSVPICTDCAADR